MDRNRDVRQGIPGGARRSITKLSSMFTLSTSAYCAVHWLVLHHFSIYVLLGAVFFGDSDCRLAFRLVRSTLASSSAARDPASQGVGHGFADNGNALMSVNVIHPGFPQSGSRPS